jgi:hypothetical protein
MRLAPGIVPAVALAAALQAPVAIAQVPCKVCRAASLFGDCDSVTMANPPAGAVSIVGTVTKVDAGQCGTDVTIDVKQASHSSMPAVIKVEVRPCFVWAAPVNRLARRAHRLYRAGQAGDEIRAMVAEAPSNGGTYQPRSCQGL